MKLDLYDGFKVSAIATPREDFAVCTLHEMLADVVSRNVDKFDFMPVTDADGTLVGVLRLADYFQAPPPEGSVREHFERLGEPHLIGADAGILDFILDADHRRFRFLVSQKGIVGLVSLSDLQELSVRTTLFSLVTSLELVMRDVIGQRFPTADSWLRLLSKHRRDKVFKHIEGARNADGAVDPLLYTQFCDKRDILLKSCLKGHALRNRASAILREVEQIRNKLAHANDYADTTAKAAGVCNTVRDLLEVKKLIEGFRVA